MNINRDGSVHGRAQACPAWLSKGYRPLFLCAAWFAVVWVLLWLSYLAGGPPDLGATGAPVWWHGHELLFGFACAVLAGFLLTAVEVWTKRQAVSPAGLAGLVGLWVAARLMFLFPGWVPYGAAAAADVLFLPVVAVLVGRAVVRARNWRNLVFVPLLAVLTVANAVHHAAALGWAPDLGGPSLRFTAYLFAFLLVFMGGRVIPFFMRARLPDAGVRTHPVLDWASTVAAAGVPVAYLVVPTHPWMTAVLGAAALLALVRLVAWRPWAAWREPLLWVLHLGYLWIALGLALNAAALAGVIVSVPAALHALLVGGLGSLTLGMMVRVALGHSGRTLTVDVVTATAFALVTAAALVRLLYDTGVLPGLAALIASGLAWSVAFAIYGYRFVPILLGPRVD